LLTSAFKKPLSISYLRSFLTFPDRFSTRFWKRRNVKREIPIIPTLSDVFNCMTIFIPKIIPIIIPNFNFFFKKEAKIYYFLHTLQKSCNNNNDDTSLCKPIFKPNTQRRNEFYKPKKYKTKELIFNTPENNRKMRKIV
jgi:hypothetical protein